MTGTMPCAGDSSIADLIRSGLRFEFDEAKFERGNSFS